MKRKKPTCTLIVAILILGLATVSVGAETKPKLFVDPPTPYIGTILGEVFTIDINIANVTGLAAWSFKLGYNTTLLDTIDAVNGPFPPESDFTLEIHEPEGYVWVYGMGVPATGNGTMATITFNVTYAASASCTLDLYATALYDVNAQPIDHDVEHGSYRFEVLGITVATNKPCYYQGKNVTIHGNLTIDGSPHDRGLVALQVIDPTNHSIVVRTVQTGPTPPPEEITILEVYTCDMYGNPKETFRRGATSMSELFYIKATVKNNNPNETKTVAIVANGYDVNGVPFGVAYVKSTLPPNQTGSLGPCPITIPMSASVGNGTVYASALNDWPLNGTPYCPEKSATFQIQTSGQGPGAPASGTNGNYNLTFKLSVWDAKKGNYTVYASSRYGRQEVTATTTFEVKIFCDVNGDGKVDIADVGIVKCVYSGVPGYEVWTTRADVNGDGKVDIGDIGLVKRAYSGVILREC